MDDRSIIEKLQETGIKNVNIHEVAREINRLYQNNDEEGLKKLRDAYVDGISKTYPGRSLKDINETANQNFLGTAMVADLVNQSNGEEASGQLSYIAKKMKKSKKPIGPVSEFYKSVFGL